MKRLVKRLVLAVDVPAPLDLTIWPEMNRRVILAIERA